MFLTIIQPLRGFGSFQTLCVYDALKLLNRNYVTHLASLSSGDILQIIFNYYYYFFMIVSGVHDTHLKLTSSKMVSRDAVKNHESVSSWL